MNRPSTSFHALRLTTRAALAAALMLPLLASSAEALVIEGVGNAALDQPQINILVRVTPNAPPLDGQGVGDLGLGDLGDLGLGDLGLGGGDVTYTIPGFLDTGASNLLIASSLAAPAEFDIQKESGWVFVDVGVSGSESFDISKPHTFQAAPYAPSADLDNPATFNQTYNQIYAPMRAAIKQAPTASPGVDPLEQIMAMFGEVNVFGMPLMLGKTVVMDARSSNQYISTFDYENLDTTNIKTYIYDHGQAPFNNAAQHTNPGVPTTQFHVQMSYGDFEAFTELQGPSEAVKPTMAHNPFIGRNPLAPAGDPSDAVPGVTIQFGEAQAATGSFLFDTGASVTMISTDMASTQGVRYRDGFGPGANPILEMLDGTAIASQFRLAIGGVGDGGTQTFSGFFLDSLLLPTIEGASNPDDNILYRRWDPNDPTTGVPVLVADIKVVNRMGNDDPSDDRIVTLDGVFGMNLLFGTARLDDPIDLFAIFDTALPGAFDWVVFDEPTGILGLQPTTQSIPEPASLFTLICIGGLLLTPRAKTRLAV